MGYWLRTHIMGGVAGVGLPVYIEELAVDPEFEAVCFGFSIEENL